MQRNVRIIVALPILLFCAVFAIWPEPFLWPLGRALLALRHILPLVPLIIYGLLGLCTLTYLRDVPRDEIQVDLDKTQSASLTLAGFCFTSMSLLISFFKEEIKSSQSGPQDIILYFAIALACFVGAYLALRYRDKNIFQFLSEAFIDNGFWCILLGLWSFSVKTAGLERLQIVFSLLMGVYFVYLIRHLWLSFKYSKHNN